MKFRRCYEGCKKCYKKYKIQNFLAELTSKNLIILKKYVLCIILYVLYIILYMACKKYVLLFISTIVIKVL